MEVRSITRQVRMAPRKARPVADLIRGKQVEAALTLLGFSQKEGRARVQEDLAGGDR